MTKIIWIMWLQGESNTPYLVRKCIASWRKHNPDWTINVLDEATLHNYVNLNDIPKNIKVAHYSDMIRLKLLIKYGGVWADSTTFCMEPLNNWLDKEMADGLFIFKHPTWERGISNWFIASEKNNFILIKLYDLLINYWNQDLLADMSTFKQVLTKICNKILSRNERTTKYWFHYIVRDLLKIYPYFAFHYLFERVISLDDKAIESWNKMGKITNEKSHFIQVEGMLSTPSDEVKEKVYSLNAHVYKLTYRYDETLYNENTLLYFLLES